MSRPQTAAVRLLTGEREPVRLATTANIALSGLQTIDGVLTEAGDRIIVKNQTDGSENGIYTASTGIWYRAADARTARTMQKGTTVSVQEGSTNAAKSFVFSTLDPVIGTDAISIVEWVPSGAQPLNGNLSAIALLSTTAYGRALLELANGTALAAMVDSFFLTPAEGDALFLTPAEGNAAYLPLSLTSAALRSALTDELGTGSAVFESVIPLVAPGGRLTLTTLVPVTTSDVTGATSIYYTPAAGDRVPVYNGTRWTSTVFTELTLALDPTAAHTGYQQSGKIFDLFVFNSGANLGTGPAWTSDTARGTGAGTTELELKNGILTNKNSITIRFGSASGNTSVIGANLATYVGSFRATADGQASDTLALRLLFNAYNQAVRPMGVYEATAAYAYSTATWRQTNAAATNQIAVLCGLAGIEVSAKCSHMVSTSSSGLCYTGIGLDSTTAPIPGSIMGAVTANATGSIVSPMYASWEGFPGLGYHYLAWLERAFGTGAQTFYGGNGATYQNGIMGRVLM